VWIERNFARLLKWRVAQKQALYIIQYGFLFLKVLQYGIRLSGSTWILRCQILEIFKVHQVHVGKVKALVKRRSQRRQLQALNKGNVNVVLKVECA